MFETSIHFEDGHFVDHCTIGDDEDTEVNDQEEIVLDSYKVILNKESSQVAVALESLPIETKKMNAYGGITVYTNNASVATAQYNETTHTILIKGLSEGSTEVVILIPKGKKAEGYYEQSISVTVTEPIVVNTSSKTNTEDYQFVFLAA